MYINFIGSTVKQKEQSYDQFLYHFHVTYIKKLIEKEKKTFVMMKLL